MPDTTRKKMVVFDLDNTLLEDRFIDVCARHYKFWQALSLVRQIDNDQVSLARRKAAFLRDHRKTELVALAETIALVPDALDVVRELKQRGYRIGIISESYQFVTQLVARKIGADFELGNELVFIAGSATGEVLIPSFFHYSKDSTCKHQVCKTNALRYICRQHKIKLEDCIVVADDDSNLCMVRHAGLGVTFRSTDELMKSVAQKHLEEKSLTDLLKYAV
jgi:HAD superfamily phosphoserine phosphatase-like hydrolase